ncbi:MAG TPA: tetratricopeptide repeat protein [Candidatus Methanoperedens sp.]|nr:tetratricopeptide repeat protein [Candidatus Methanoperedens sp.]
MNRTLAVLLALAALVLIAFSPVLRNEFVGIDDGTYILENPHVARGLTVPGAVWAFTNRGYAMNWHPLTWLSHMLDVSLFGLAPRGHHAVNLLLHLLNALLLFLVLGRWTGAFWRSALVAALFAVHPLHVESVAWASERKDVLSALFFLLTLGAYRGYVGRPGGLRYLAVAGCLTLGLLSKQMLVTLPFLLLVLDVWPLGRLRGPLRARSLAPVVLEKLPLAALSAIFSLVVYLIQTEGGAHASLPGLTLPVRAANALMSYAAYLAKTVWPHELIVFYPHPRALPGLGPALLAAGALLGLSLAAALGLRRRPWLAAGWLWYLGTLVPVIGLVQVGRQALADRYTYVPLVGVFIAASWGLAAAVRGRRQRLIAGVAAGAILLALTAASREQVRLWRDGKTLFGHAVAVDPRSSLAHHNLANVLLKEGHTQEAIEHYRQVTRLLPEYAEAYVGLGVASGVLGLLEEEASWYRQALAVDPRNYKALVNLGAAYRDLGRLQEAGAAEAQARALLKHP